MYKLQRGPTGATTLEAAQIIARNNSRGMPLRRGRDIHNVVSDDRCCEEWQNDGWRKLNSKEAEETYPIFDLALRENPLEKALRQTDEGWLGTLAAGESLRVDFTPSDQGFGHVAALLCDSPFPKNCYGVVFSGHSNGRMRYNWMRYGDGETSGPYWVPGGGSATLRATVDSKEETIREGWVPVRRYTLQLERSPSEQLLVYLEGGDPEQEEQLVFDIPEKKYKYLFVDRYKKEGDLSVQGSRAWEGRVDPGKAVPLTWTPGTSRSARLGLFLCQRPQGDACYGALVTSANDKALGVEWARYGSGEKTKAWLPSRSGSAVRKMVLSSKRTDTISGWTQPEYNLTLRVQGLRVTLGLDGGEADSWDVPVGYNYLIVASYKGKGLVSVRAARETLSTPGVMWPVWGMDSGRTEATLTSPPVKAPPGHQLCLIVAARVPADAQLLLGFKGAGPGYRQIINVINIVPGESDDGWVMRREMLDLPLDLVRRSDRIQLVLTAMRSTEENVFVQLADMCDPISDRQIINIVPDTLPVDKLFGFDIASTSAANMFEGKSDPCLHGGILDVAAARCRCPPGFTGPTCEIGCGNNKFGTQCQDTCSDDLREGCEGVLLCGPGLKCKCASGFYGKACEHGCKATKYGPNCEFRCGRCHNGAPCDPYTGHCPQGCSSGFQPPLCKESCGNTGGERDALINNGHSIDVINFPWQAGLYRNESGTMKFTCGGSLIRDNLVLTAAHCVTDDRGVKRNFQYMVALGKTKSAWDAPEDTKAIKRKVLEVKTEAGYVGTGTFANDIAVLILENKAKFSEVVTPVCVNWTPENNVDLRPGVKGKLAGWGKLESSSEESETLNAATVPIVSKNECFQNLPSAIQRYITQDKICAGFLRVPDGVVPSPSQGDSGGGLCFVDKKKTWYVRGVVSVGLRGYPISLYTNVNQFQDFLRDTRDKVAIQEAINREFEN
ncbi:Proclotting enzyme [Frankliniella fusca]|uniref:Proclotting enzyme n=1 Tax=Frankliniella fusca TaxID=407009 RepID=A0AAE1HUG3_9NEOP|nr:Proclotting enzyme [Frankliniella fusca]